jgi:hypothetical protein
MSTLLVTEISGLADPTYASGGANKRYVDAVSGSLSTRIGGSTFNSDLYITSANALDIFADSSNINRVYVDGISGNLETRIQALEDSPGGGGPVFWSSQTTALVGSIYYDYPVVIAYSGVNYGNTYRFQVSGPTYFSGTTTFIGELSGLSQPTYNSGAANKYYVDTISGNILENYMKSSVALSTFSHSTNINSRFVASGLTLTSLSSQNTSGGRIQGVLEYPPLTFSIANVALYSCQSITLAKYKCPSGTVSYIWQAAAANSGGVAASGLWIQMLSGNSAGVWTNIYKTSCATVQQGFPLAQSTAASLVEIRLMFSGNNAYGSQGRQLEFGTGFMQVGIQ